MTVHHIAIYNHVRGYKYSKLDNKTDIFAANLHVHKLQDIQKTIEM